MYALTVPHGKDLFEGAAGWRLCDMRIQAVDKVLSRIKEYSSRIYTRC